MKVSDLTRPVHHRHAAVRSREKCDERCDGASEQFALAADHLSSCDRHQLLVGRVLPTPVVRVAIVRYPLCDRLVDDRRIRRPKRFSHPRNAPGGNDREAGSRYGPPRHGRPLLVHAQSALPRRHDTFIGDWTGLRDRVVFAACCPRCLRVQKLAIEREERHLQARFGRTYVDYAERARRWI